MGRGRGFRCFNLCPLYTRERPTRLRLRLRNAPNRKASLKIDQREQSQTAQHYLRLATVQFRRSLWLLLTSSANRATRKFGQNKTRCRRSPKLAGRNGTEWRGSSLTSGELRSRGTFSCSYLTEVSQVCVRRSGGRRGQGCATKDRAALKDPL
jgi:hypothetical protein